MTSPNQAPQAVIYGPINPEQAAIMAEHDVDSPQAMAMLMAIGATAAPEAFALETTTGQDGREHADTFVSLDPNDFGTRLNIKNYPFADRGLPEPAEALTNLRNKAAEEDEQAAVEAAVVRPELDHSIRRETERRMGIAAADRANRKAAGLPPRTHDLR